MSWLGRAAALSIAAAVTLAAVQWLWPGDAPSWLSVSGVFFYFGVVLVALWTSVRLFGTSSRLQAPGARTDVDLRTRAATLAAATGPFAMIVVRPQRSET